MTEKLGKKAMCPHCKKEEKHVMRKSTICNRLADLERALEKPANFAEQPEALKVWKQETQLFGARYEVRSILCGLRGWCWDCRMKSVAELEMSTLREAL